MILLIIQMLEKKLANKIASSDYERGILFCGTGAGMAIVANKVKGVRAVCINDPYTAERKQQHQIMLKS